MMDKAAKPNSNSNGAQSGDIHARIAAEAAKLRNAARRGVQDAGKTPALCALLDSAREAFEQSIQKSFQHEGRTYWLRVAVPMAKMMLFDSPTSLKPMVFAMVGSEREFGHEPP